MLSINVKKLISFIIVGLVVISCDDDSNPAAPEEHIDAEGFALEIDGTEVYRQFEGAITGGLTLAVNETLELSIHFLDHDGNEIEHAEEEGEEEEEELNFTIEDSSIISVEAEDHEEDGDGHDHGEEHHELGFELTGLSAGATTFSLSLMHDGHADFTSLPISVTVNSAMASCSKQLCIKGCCSVPIYASK